jgi:hypothetical protein
LFNNSDGSFSFRNWDTKTYLSVDAGVNPTTATTDATKFSVLFQSDGRACLKNKNGKYLGSSDGINIATSTTCGNY